ncbi:MAG TPA: type II toxin-antitoxin system PemK/MazF family toxin [Methanoregulaceae archaeon]|nr:type II toxin-antitoxin system PemK/MazF family toxin [Methanoregulaceae archaeon]HPD76718.1 type II toxin-antitoxin system PemK/MazF family toxin [Methanoregulaceae archaeon]HRY76520.1 type II toxin-antitoxin system PemK/MazF family toxin [Methanoregulaceae archaeon]
MKGKIILIRFPFTDMSGAKLRPALVIHENPEDVVVAFISSKAGPPFYPSDLLLSSDHPAFPSSGLKVSSVIKFDKVATVSKDLIEGEIGTTDESLRKACNDVMNRVFRL